MRIKPTVGYHYVPTKMLKIQNTNNIKSFKDMKQQELSLLPVGIQNGEATGKTVLWFPKHTHTLRSSDCTPGYLLKGLEIYDYTETCTRMFTAALFIIPKTEIQANALP